MPLIGSSRTDSTSIQNTQTWNDSFNSAVNEAFNLSIGDTVVKIGPDADKASDADTMKTVTAFAAVVLLVFILSG